ncbi:hypothetical protein OAD28_08765 [Flavobacteriales bacterium]|nr:hypothetical protein [Flavobacteriales bacterium]
MREDWTECCFEDLLDYEQPTKYIVKSTKYNDSYKMPVLTAGKTFIKGYTNETDGIFDNLPTIIFDDFTTATQYVNFKFKVKSSAMKILVPTSKLVNMPLVYYAMQVNQVRSDTHKRYWISVFAKKKFLLPPFVEQKAIVKKIEELFSNLDSGISDLKIAQEKLTIYKQAVLKKAFDGDFTTLFRSQHKIEQNAKDYVIELRKTSSKNSNNPISIDSKGWAECLFDDLLDYEQPTSYIVRSTNYNDTNKTPVLTAGKTFIKGYTNETDGIFDDLPTIIFDDFTTASQFVNFKFKVKSSAMKILVPTSKKVDMSFVYYAMQLNKIRSDTHKRYWISTYSKKTLFIPSLDEQNQIVREIENRLSVCDKVEESIKESLQKAIALRHSILKKAFDGKLLSEEEIAKCQKDKYYEPTSVLLEKIRKEKETKQLKKVTPKKKKK